MDVEAKLFGSYDAVDLGDDARRIPGINAVEGDVSTLQERILEARPATTHSASFVEGRKE